MLCILPVCTITDCRSSVFRGPLRGTILNRAYGTHQNLYINISLFFLLLLVTIFGPILLWSPVILIQVLALEVRAGNSKNKKTQIPGTSRRESTLLVPQSRFGDKLLEI